MRALEISEHPFIVLPQLGSFTRLCRREHEIHVGHEAGPAGRETQSRLVKEKEFPGKSDWRGGSAPWLDRQRSC